MIENIFHEVQFPPDISYGSSGGACYSTDIVTLGSGYEQRNINWQQSRGQWNVAHGIKTLTQLEKLITFFHLRRGKAIGFRFKDWGDYKAHQSYIGTSEGDNRLFQLQKVYTDGVYSISRAITKPVQGTVNIYINGTELTNTGYLIDYTKGILTLLTNCPSGAIITADFEFDVPARFDSDIQEINFQSFKAGGWSNISIVEIRV